MISYDAKPREIASVGPAPQHHRKLAVCKEACAAAGLHICMLYSAEASLTSNGLWVVAFKTSHSHFENPTVAILHGPQGLTSHTQCQLVRSCSLVVHPDISWCSTSRGLLSCQPYMAVRYQESWKSSQHEDIKLSQHSRLTGRTPNHAAPIWARTAPGSQDASRLGNAIGVNLQGCLHSHHGAHRKV